jgi:hypothetical protein
MSDYDQQLRQVCLWNRALARENARLREELHRGARECRELDAANAMLRSELRGADDLLSETLEAALKGRRRGDRPKGRS